MVFVFIIVFVFVFAFVFHLNTYCHLISGTKRLGEGDGGGVWGENWNFISEYSNKMQHSSFSSCEPVWKRTCILTLLSGAKRVGRDGWRDGVGGWGRFSRQPSSPPPPSGELARHRIAPGSVCQLSKWLQLLYFRKNSNKVNHSLASLLSSISSN